MKTDSLINAWNLQENKTHKIAHNMLSDWSESEKKKLRGYLGNSKITVGQQNLK